MLLFTAHERYINSSSPYISNFTQMIFQNNNLSQILINNQNFQIYNNTPDIGGSKGRAWRMPPPLRDPILSFLYTLSTKSTCIGGQHPPNGSTPHHGKSWIRHCQMSHVDLATKNKIDFAQSRNMKFSRQVKTVSFATSNYRQCFDT